MANNPGTGLLVAAFDFGTTYSGYAFSFRDEPLKVQTNQAWNAGTEKLISLKTSTSVLLNPSGKFAKFGFEAENKFVSLAEDDEEEGWRLFRRFKMMLHQNKTLSRTSTVEDIQGKTMLALPIFSMAIKYLRDHLLESIQKQKVGIEETDISYVITVPAIWDDSAKQFMREAAKEAGIVMDRLKFALEPEAASIWCEQIDANAKIALAGVGTQYMVIDLGGGTADISVHEKLSVGKLKEIHRASGGPWGGIYVDENYTKALDRYFGKGAIDAMKQNNIGDYFDLLREFETKKRTVTLSSEGKINFRISMALRKASEKVNGISIEDFILSQGHGSSVTVKGGDKLRVDSNIVRKWFEPPINNVMSHTRKLMRESKMSKVQTILLVGGFGESEYVQERIKREIPEKKVIVPAEAGLVVLKGAVRFGHDPSIVKSRIMSFSYGNDVTDDYDPNKHPENRKTIIHGDLKVRRVFMKFVSSGDEVTIGQEVSHVFTPIEMTSSPIRIYRSTNQNSSYVDEDDCKKLGEFCVFHPDGETLEDKEFTVTFIFGDTELMVKSRIKKTGKEESCVIDCLKK